MRAAVPASSTDIQTASAGAPSPRSAPSRGTSRGRSTSSRSSRETSSTSWPRGRSSISRSRTGRRWRTPRPSGSGCASPTAPARPAPRCSCATRDAGSSRRWKANAASRRPVWPRTWTSAATTRRVPCRRSSTRRSTGTSPTNSYASRPPSRSILKAIVKGRPQRFVLGKPSDGAGTVALGGTMYSAGDVRGAGARARRARLVDVRRKPRVLHRVDTAGGQVVAAAVAARGAGCGKRAPVASTVRRRRVSAHRLRGCPRGRPGRSRAAAR